MCGQEMVSRITNLYTSRNDPSWNKGKHYNILEQRAAESGIKVTPLVKTLIRYITNNK